jgi:hypothetical protein
MNDPNRRDERGHESVWLLLPWYANGTLEAAERRLVEEHLAGCAACREELASCNVLAAALRSGQDGAPTPHPIQLERLLARVAEIEESENEASGRSLAAYLEDHAGDGGEQAGSAERRAHAAPPSPRAPAAPLGPPAPSGRRHAKRAALLAATPRPVRIALAGQLAALVLLSLALAVGPARPLADRSSQARPGAGPAALYHTLSAPAAGAEAAAARPQIRVVFAETATEKQVREVLLRARGRLVDGPSPLGAYTLEIPAPTPAAAPPVPPLAEAGAEETPGTAGAGGAAGGASPGPNPHPLAADGAPDSLGIVLAYLRSRSIVRFAEPVAGTAPPASAPAASAPAGPRGRSSG